MPYTFHDTFLRKFCTEEQEDIAVAQVEALGYSFSAAWVETLAVLQCYMNVCLARQADTDDLFSEKYKMYAKEYARQLGYAKAATPDSTTGIVPTIMTIPIERA